MTVYAVVAGILLPFGTTWLLLRELMPGSTPAARMERIGASLAFAIGATSATFFLWRLAGGSPDAYRIVEPLGHGVIGSGLLLRRARVPSDRTAAVHQSWLHYVAAGLLLIAVIGASAVRLAQGFAALDQGAWDAWQIWNLRAAFLAAPTPDWVTGFNAALEWSHPDYPLLVPSSVARLWVFGGAMSTQWPIVFAAEIYVAAILLTAGTLLRISGVAGAALGLALLLVPEYGQFITAQCADAAVGLYVLLSVSLLSGGRAAGRLVASGAAAGLAAWTKNEGLVATLAIPLIVGVVTAFSEDRREAARRALLMIAGAVASLVVLALFKLLLSPPSDLLIAISATGPVEKMLDPARHGVVFRYMLTVLAGWGHWSLPPLWFVLAWLAVGFWNRRAAPAASAIGVAIVVVMLITFYAVFLTTPYDLAWHMQTSWARLISQLWPTLAWSAAASALALHDAEAWRLV